MKKKISFIGVVPARAGSKGLINKNIYALNKKPLISFTFNSIKSSKLIKSYVLTDSKRIKKISKKYNINSEYNRPKSVSRNKTSMHDTLHNFYKWTQSKKIIFDYMVVLQPTSPLRSYLDINKSINLIKNKKYKGLFSASETLEHPYEQIKGKTSNWKPVLSNPKKYHRRQDFDFKSYFMNGAIYIFHYSLFRNKKNSLKKFHFFTMPKSRSFEINDIEDIKIINALVKNKKN